MLPAKAKSGLSDTSSNKNTPSTPRVSKVSRAGSARSDSGTPPPPQKPRVPIDKSPKSIESKPATKISTTPIRQPRALKASELQAQLDVAHEDLKKVKEQLAFAEQEKNQALEELKDAKKLADEANEKLQETIAAQKRAEESLEIEKFRAVELEQAGIEAAQKREEEWQNEMESIRNQHATDVSALLSVTQELQRAKHELAMAAEAKNTALSHADDATKIAEINAEKVELLSGEVSRLKALLDSKMEDLNNEAVEIIKKLETEVDALKDELERAKAAEEKLVKMESLIEGLRIEVTDAKMAESDARRLVDESKEKAELLEARVEEAHESEKASSDSLASAMKQLEASNMLLQDSDSEISTLKGKIESLENELSRHKADLEESDRRLSLAQQEALEMGTTVEILKSKLQTLEEEKQQALNDEKVAALNIQSLSEERNKLIDQLNISKDEGEKTKKAMEGLSSALHEVSTEARETQERLLTKQAEIGDAHAQIEKLKSALKNTEERYEVMLDEARYEVVCLNKTVEKSENEAENSRAEWDAKELDFVGSIRKLEEEVASLKAEMAKMVDSLKGTEHEAQVAREDKVEMLNKLREAENGATAANDAAEEAKAESLQLKDRLLDKENELQSITQENEDLRMREAAALEKVKELSALLAETTATAKRTEENGILSNSERDYDLLPNTMEFHKMGANESEAEKPKFDVPLQMLEDHQPEDPKSKQEGVNGNQNVEEEEHMEVKMWESFKTSDKDLASEKEHEAESTDDDLDSKMDFGSFDQISGLLTESTENGTTLPTKQLQQKKKKALLQKFGKLLKKGSTK